MIPEEFWRTPRPVRPDARGHRRARRPAHGAARTQGTALRAGGPAMPQAGRPATSTEPRTGHRASRRAGTARRSRSSGAGIRARRRRRCASSRSGVSASSSCDIAVRPPAPGELRRFVERYGEAALLDTEGRRYRDLGLGFMRFGPGEVLERVLADPSLLRLPLARFANDVRDRAGRGGLDGGPGPRGLEGPRRAPGQAQVERPSGGPESRPVREIAVEPGTGRPIVVEEDDVASPVAVHVGGRHLRGAPGEPAACGPERPLRRTPARLTEDPRSAPPMSPPHGRPARRPARPGRCRRSPSAYPDRRPPRHPSMPRGRPARPLPRRGHRDAEAGGAEARRSDPFPQRGPRAGQGRLRRHR